ncbi:MAG TPA: MFS transporter [Gaiellaceae bacterium]|nr:MFS transporter [Gaiellaceae bacterium]
MRPLDPLVRVRVLFCLVGVAESAIVPFLPLLLRDRGLSPQAIGAVLALLAGVAFASGPLWGYLADRALGYERTLILAMLGTAGGAVALSFAHTVAAIAVAGSVTWALRSPNLAVADSIALARLGPARRGSYGSVRLWMSLGFAAGALAWGGLVSAVGIDLVAPLYAGLTALNALGLVIVFRKRSLWRRTAFVRKPRAALRIPVAAVPALALFLMALFLTNAAYYATYNFAAVQIAALGGGAVFVGLAAGFQAGAEAPSMAWTRRLGRRLRPGTVFAAGAAIFVAVDAVWALAASPETLALLRLVSGVGFGLTYVGTVLVADELVPHEFRATGQAAMKAVGFGIAPVAGSLGGGLVYGYFGSTPFFVTAAGVTTAAALLARWSDSPAHVRRRPGLQGA